jgi:hypothetical protein
MIEAHMIEQRIEQRSGQKPTGLLRRTNYVNGTLRQTVKVLKGDRWTPMQKLRKTVKRMKKTKKH